jgi:hypothetical protein
VNFNMMVQCKQDEAKRNDNKTSAQFYSSSRCPATLSTEPIFAMHFLPSSRCTRLSIVRSAFNQRLLSLEAAAAAASAAASKRSDLSKQSSDSNASTSTSVSPTVRERVQKYREGARDRMQVYSDRAKHGFEEFREHPRESAVEGAKGASKLFRQYGPVFVVTYGGLYFAVLGTLYLGVESGVIDPISLLHQISSHTVNNSVDAVASAEVIAGTSDSTPRTTLDFVVNFLENHSITQPYAKTVRDDYPWLSNFLVAWISTKFTEPIRLPLAAALTPRIARIFGWAKPNGQPQTVGNKSL